MYVFIIILINWNQKINKSNWTTYVLYDRLLIPGCVADERWCRLSLKKSGRAPRCGPCCRPLTHFAGICKYAAASAHMRTLTAYMRFRVHICMHIWCIYAPTNAYMLPASWNVFFFFLRFSSGLTCLVWPNLFFRAWIHFQSARLRYASPLALVPVLMVLTACLAEDLIWKVNQKMLAEIV